MRGIRTVPAIIILFILLTSAAGEQITVCESDCNFTHIQPAIVASKNGDAILVKSGDYEENIFIDKKLKIIGNKAVLQSSVPYVPAVQIICEDVIIEGLKVSDSSTALKAINAENVSVFNCSFSQNDCGVNILGGQDINLIGNTFRHNQVHIMLQDTAETTVRQNIITGGSTGISLVNSETTNITENKFREMNAGVELENSVKNELGNNEFKQCDAGVYSILSNNNQFSGNKVKNSSVFLDLRLSASNKIDQNSVDNCTYSKTTNSDYNFYTLKNMNLSGKGFEFSLINPSLPKKYVNLSQGVNLTINSLNSTDEGHIHLRASIPIQNVVGLNLSSVGFYKLDDLKLISNKTFQDDKVVINTSLNQSGEYILLAQKEKSTGAQNEGGDYYSTSTTTEGIIMFAVVIASIVVMLYILSRGK